MVTEEVDPTDVPLVVVDRRGRRRVGDQPVIDIAPGQDDDLGELTMAAAVAVGTQVVKLAALPWRLTGAALARMAEGSLGQAVEQGLRTVLEEPAADGREEIAQAGRRAEEQLARLMGVVVPVVVEAVDVDLVIDQLDVNNLLTHIDIDALIARVDLNDVLDRVDVAALLDRVDVDGLLARVDIDALVGRVDADALLSRVDVNALMERVDIDALMDRVDIDALMERTRIEEIVARSTGQVADSALDLGRRQAVGLDAVVMRIVDRVLGRDPAQTPDGPDALVVVDGDGAGQ